MDYCLVRYPWAFYFTQRLSCDGAARGYFQAVRTKYGASNSDEESSADLYAEYRQYPSTGSVNCSPTSGRCLPVHYLTLEGRPLSPQNIPYMVTSRAIPIDVVRAHLQYEEGPPTDDTSLFKRFSDWRNTGELVLQVTYPLRASFSSVVSCPTETSPGQQTLYINSSTYPVSTADSTRKTTRIHIKSCTATSSAEELSPLLEFHPRQARYEYGETAPEYLDGDRVRHYQHIRAESCGTVPVSYPAEVPGSWLGTDCYTSRNHGFYADYYSFSVPSTKAVQIDLSYAGDYIDTYLYLLRGDSYTGAAVTENDDHGGTHNSRIVHTVTQGDYTVVATTYGTSRHTGDYQLSIRDEGCPTTPFVGSQVAGSWTSSDCASSRRAGRFVDYYTFEVEGSQTGTVQIDLVSSTDPYLFLVTGVTRRAPPILRTTMTEGTA